MKSLTRIGIFLLPLLLAVTTFAQDRTQVAVDNGATPAASAQESKNAIIITFGAVNGEYKQLFDLGTENRQGYTGALNVKIVGDKTRLGAKFRVDQVNGTRKYLLGPELGREIGFVEPYAHALFGVEDDYEGATGKRYVRLYGGGVRLNFGHFVLNPFQYDVALAEGLGQRPVSQVSASVGIRY
jgi:hypothetical protein